MNILQYSSKSPPVTCLGLSSAHNHHYICLCMFTYVHIVCLVLQAVVKCEFCILCCMFHCLPLFLAVCVCVCACARRSNVFDTIQRGEREEAPAPAQRKEWVEVQKKTFTNWFRDRVKNNGCKPLNDIETDLEDGCLLIDLVRVLTEGAHGRRT